MNRGEEMILQLTREEVVYVDIRGQIVLDGLAFFFFLGLFHRLGLEGTIN